ncbi:MAG: cupin domain-containing protein [Carbonactinosporaceae bacterium]
MTDSRSVAQAVQEESFPRSPEDPPELRTFYDEIDGYHLQPLWTQTGDLMPFHPRPDAVPWLWRWSRLKPLAQRAGDLVPIERGGERRVLALSNPGLGGRPFATPTLWAAVQYLGPRESAPAHRHTPGAIRFVLEGEGVWTLVNGDPCAMASGDLILTPSWNWHEHHNPHDEPMVWFDGLDIPLVKALDAVFYENYPDLYVDPNQPAPPRSDSEKAYGAPGLRPDGLEPPGRHSPLLAYRFADTDRTLDGLLETRDEPMVGITYVDPLSGRDALPTMRCAMHRLRPGRRTPSRRSAGSSVVVAFRGSGSSVVDGTRMHWQAGDMFAVPSWAAVDHEAEVPADLFTISDAPVLEALGLDRVETLPEHQGVAGTFDATSAA